jgi:Protein of unknown function (DUF1572)
MRQSPIVDVAAHCLEDFAVQMSRLRALAEGAVAQLSDEELFRQIDADSNSIAMVMRHVAGNLKSRFTDLLTTDGEKPDRHRDREFEIPAGTTRETVIADWDLGFSRLESALASLSPADLLKQITIRGETHTVLQALHRSLAHTSMHVGQIVLIAKHLRGANWRTLSIPRGQSETFTGLRRF